MNNMFIDRNEKANNSLRHAAFSEMAKRWQKLYDLQFGFLDRFSSQKSCIKCLEDLRWKDNYKCALCGGEHVSRKKDGERLGRWRCYRCYSSYNVLSGTTMSKTRVPLPKWFAAIYIMVTAGSKVSSRQLARDLDLTQPTALRLQNRIRETLVTEHSKMSEYDIRFVDNIAPWDGRWQGQWQIIPLLARYLIKDMEGQIDRSNR